MPELTSPNFMCSENETQFENRHYLGEILKFTDVAKL